jgi:hypothetical protein
MKNKCVQSGLLVTALCVLSIMPLQAQARCSLGSSAGNWAYTYTGTVFAPNPLPAAAVGHFSQDAQGNVTGSQTHIPSVHLFGVEAGHFAEDGSSIR